MALGDRRPHLEFGFTPNRVAALGETSFYSSPDVDGVALCELPLRQRGAFAAQERWQIAYLPVYSIWLRSWLSCSHPCSDTDETGRQFDEGCIVRTANT